MHLFRGLVACVLSAGIVAAAVPEVEPGPAPAAVSLEDRLTTGLQARRPADVAYVGRVVDLVESGTLPGKLVDSTFLWAVRRRQRHPLPAFREALRLQAARIGVDID